MAPAAVASLRNDLVLAMKLSDLHTYVVFCKLDLPKALYESFIDMLSAVDAMMCCKLSVHGHALPCLVT